MTAPVVITRNTIRDNNRMIVNDGTPYNDRGANGVVLYRTSGPLTVSLNRISGHRASSTDYGVDGGAFEIYAAGGISIRGNRLSDNLNVLETGTDGDGCPGLRFVRNIAVRGSSRTAEGLILRCAGGALIARNTFYGLSDFTYYVTERGAFAGTADGLRILNNISVTTAKTYSLGSIPAGMVVDNNVVRNPAGKAIAWVNGFGNTTSLAQLRAWTGFDVHGTSASPRFMDAAAGDFRLRASSPAIDRARRISGLNDTFNGAAPDIGRWER